MKKDFKIFGRVALVGISIFLAVELYRALGSFGYKMEDRLGCSESSRESKKRKVFVEQYCIICNPSKLLKVREAFLERTFGYGKDIDETREVTPEAHARGVPNYNLVLVIPDNDKYYFVDKSTWAFDHPTYLDGHGKAVSLDLNSAQIKDTVAVDVLRWHPNMFEKVGEIVIVKCVSGIISK